MKNIHLEELAKKMLNNINLPKYLRADVVCTACYVMNCILIRSVLKLTLCELYKVGKSNISHLHVFTCKCFVLNNENDNLGKYDDKVDEGLLLGYFTSSKVFLIFNK